MNTPPEVHTSHHTPARIRCICALCSLRALWVMLWGSGPNANHQQ